MRGWIASILHPAQPRPGPAVYINHTWNQNSMTKIESVIEWPISKNNITWPQYDTSLGLDLVIISAVCGSGRTLTRRTRLGCQDGGGDYRVVQYRACVDTWHVTRDTWRGGEWLAGQTAAWLVTLCWHAATRHSSLCNQRVTQQWWLGDYLYSRVCLAVCVGLDNIIPVSSQQQLSAPATL